MANTLSILTTIADSTASVVAEDPVTTSTDLTGSLVPTATATLITDGRITESTDYGLPVTVLYSTSRSLTGVPKAETFISTITSESIVTAYLPTTTLYYTEGTGARTFSTSVLYGPVGMSTLLTTYATTFVLSSPSTPPAGPTRSAGTGSLSNGAIAGLAIGVTIAVLIVVAIAAGWVVVQKRRRRRPALPEVTSSSHGGYEKPELDATEVFNPPAGQRNYGQPEKPGVYSSSLSKHSRSEYNNAEMDVESGSKTDGRAELDGQMIATADVIRRKKVASANARMVVVDEKEVTHEK